MSAAEVSASGARGHWIAGREVDAAGGGTLTSHAPGTGEELAKIAAGGPADVDAAVAAARAALPEWRQRRPIERGRILYKIATTLRADIAELGRIEAAEGGKPQWQAEWEIEGAASYFEFYAGLVNLPGGDVVDMGSDLLCFTRREPYGVIGAITPWNVSLNQVARAVAPALAAGNTVVAKPSEFTSLTALALAAAATEAGMPDGVLNVVTGTGPEVGAALVGHRDVRKISFTGSVRAGREIGAIAADRLLPLTLELGGKSPNIVFEDADLQAAAAGAVTAIMLNAGQVCTAGSRLLVADSIHDELVELIVAEMAALVPGKDYGQLTTEAQYRKVLEYIEIGRQEGATLRAGGNPGDGWHIEPTLFTDATDQMRIVREEIFGPVLTVSRFADEAEAVTMANDSDYGLAAGLWTRDISRAHRVAGELEAGQVFINGWKAGLVEGPAGGVKNSGYGRERGIEALTQYTQTKFVVVTL